MLPAAFVRHVDVGVAEEERGQNGTLKGLRKNDTETSQGHHASGYELVYSSVGFITSMRAGVSLMVVC